MDNKHSNEPISFYDWTDRKFSLDAKQLTFKFGWFFRPEAVNTIFTALIESFVCANYRTIKCKQRAICQQAIHCFFFLSLFFFFFFFLQTVSVNLEKPQFNHIKIIIQILFVEFPSCIWYAYSKMRPICCCKHLNNCNIVLIHLLHKLNVKWNDWNHVAPWTNVSTKPADKQQTVCVVFTLLGDVNSLTLITV